MNLHVDVTSAAHADDAEPADGVERAGAGKQVINVLQFICSTGFYGAEGWILALANNTDRSAARHHLAVTREWETHDLELSRRFRALGLPVHELALAGRFDIRVIPRLVTLIREHDIHVIHTHGYKSDLLGVVAARIAGIGSVCTPHGFENARDWKLRAYIRLGCAAFKFFDRVVPLSPELLADVRRYKVPEAKIKYIANGVDLKPVDAIRRQREEERKSGTDTVPVMGYIGQLIDRKTVKDIVSAFQSLATTMPRLRLVIVGDGDCRSALEAQVADSPYADRVEFRGFVDDPLEHLRAFDLFVMCSSLEGIPRCLMESMAMGVPIVAYDIAGVDQLITHEVTGLLAPHADLTALTQQCQRLLSDEALSASIAQAARMRVDAEFSAQRMASAYLAIFRKLLKDRSKTHAR